MPQGSPFFSIIIPVYNKGPHIQRSISSVLNQTFQNFELILINDASTDNSLEEMQKFTDPRIRILYRSEPGSGGYAALIPFFLSDKWNPAIPIVQTLSFYIFIRSIFNASGSLMMAKGKADWTFYWNMVMLFVIPSTTYLALEISKSAIGVCFALGGIFFVFFFFHYALFLRNLLGPFLKEYMLTIAKPFLISASMGLFTYLLSLPIQGWHNAFSAMVLIVFGVMYYLIMTMYLNPMFVNELEKMLPNKMSKVLYHIRRKFRLLYAY